MALGPHLGSAQLTTLCHNKGRWVDCRGYLCNQSVNKRAWEFAFVDNTDLCILGQSTAELTACQMQDLVTNWEGLLQMRGGVLLTEKCFWYLIEQQLIEDVWKYQPLSHTGAELCMCDLVGRLTVIRPLEVCKAWCTLGVQLAPDGNSEEEFEYLKSVAIDWKTKMERACLLHDDAVFSLWTLILWKLVYPLAFTTFTEQQCTEIMQHILNTGLLKIRCV